MKYFFAFSITIVVTLVFTNIISCQNKKSKTETDIIDEALDKLDKGQSQQTIELLTPVIVTNKSPKVVSLMAAAYLSRSHISTHEIIDLFLNFSVQNTKSNVSDDENMRDFTQLVSALDNFFLKLSMVPAIETQEQENDLHTAIFYLNAAKPSTPGIALQRGLVRLILAKYIFTSLVSKFLKPQENNKCELDWGNFYENMQNLMQVSQNIVIDLQEAHPKKANSWVNSLEVIDNIRKKLTNFEKTPIDPLALELFIYFLKSHSIEIGCTI